MLLHSYYCWYQLLQADCIHASWSGHLCLTRQYSQLCSPLLIESLQYRMQPADGMRH